MKFALTAFTLLLLLVTSCGGESKDGNKLHLLAVTTQIGDFARNVGGERIDLETLLRPNQDAHDFDPEPSQLRAISRADIILRNGLGLDDFLDDAIENAEGEIVTVTDGVTTRESSGEHDADGGNSHEEHDVDPHVWLAVDNARVMVENIREALVKADAANADYYRNNATAYLQKLDALDNDIAAQVQTIPAACRKLVTNHEVLGYYADAYGLELTGSVIPSTASDAQPSAADVAQIVKRIRDEKVPAIFAEASINPALAAQVAREANIKVVDDLYGDSLGAADSPGGTYEGMMRENTRKIVEALRNC